MYYIVPAHTTDPNTGEPESGHVVLRKGSCDAVYECWNNPASYAIATIACDALNQEANRIKTDLAHVEEQRRRLREEASKLNASVEDILTSW